MVKVGGAGTSRREGIDSCSASPAVAFVYGCSVASTRGGKMGCTINASGSTGNEALALGEAR